MFVVYCRAFHAASFLYILLLNRAKRGKDEMQRVAIHYAQPVILYSFMYVVAFHFFSNISKTISEPSQIWFCREFQALSFDKKECSN